MVERLQSNEKAKTIDKKKEEVTRFNQNKKVEDPIYKSMRDGIMDTLAEYGLIGILEQGESDY